MAEETKDQAAPAEATVDAARGTAVTSDGRLSHAQRVEPKPVPEARRADRDFELQKKAASLKWARENAGLIQRPLRDWGLLGKGDTVRGPMHLVDLRDGKQYQFPDGYVLDQDTVYANGRNFPTALLAE